jgi:hypothetical protein
MQTVYFVFVFLVCFCFFFKEKQKKFVSLLVSSSGFFVFHFCFEYFFWGGRCTKGALDFLTCELCLLFLPLSFVLIQHKKSPK